jgi:hypothetical protein
MARAITPKAPCKHRTWGMRRYLLPTIADSLLSWVSHRCEQLSTRRALTHLTHSSKPMRLTRHACTGGFTHLALCATASHCWHCNHRIVSRFGARLTSCDNEISPKRDSLSPDHSAPWPYQPRVRRALTITDDPCHLTPPPQHPRTLPWQREARALSTCDAPNTTASQTQDRLHLIELPFPSFDCSRDK